MESEGTRTRGHERSDRFGYSEDGREWIKLPDKRKGFDMRCEYVSNALLDQLFSVLSLYRLTLNILSPLVLFDLCACFHFDSLFSRFPILA